MRARSLDRRVTIQRKTSTQLPSGEPVDGWSNVVLRRPASMWPVKGDERFAAPEETAHEQIEFRVRWSENVASLSPLDRIIYPALTESEAADAGHVIPERSIHDVLAVHEIGRRDGLKIVTQRRSDVLT